MSEVDVSSWWSSDEVPEGIEERLEHRREAAEQAGEPETRIAAEYLLSNWQDVSSEVYHGTHLSSAKQMIEDEAILPGGSNDAVTGETSTSEQVFGTTLIPAARYYSKKAWPKSVEEEYEIARKQLDAGDNLQEVEEYGDRERAELARFIDDYTEWYDQMISAEDEVPVYDPDGENERSEKARLKEEGRQRGFEINPPEGIPNSMHRLLENTDGFEMLPDSRDAHYAVQVVIGFDRSDMKNDRKHPQRADIMWSDEFEATSYQNGGEEAYTPLSEIMADEIDISKATVYVEGTAFMNEDGEFEDELAREHFDEAEIVPLEALEMKHEEYMREKYEEKGVLDYGKTDGYRLRLSLETEEWNTDPAKIHLSG